MKDFMVRGPSSYELFTFALSESLPAFFLLFVVAIILKYGLHFLFKLAHLPNYSTVAPSGILKWTKLSPPDILFRLATLAALNLVMYWFPIYYYTTYTHTNDDRAGGELVLSEVFCPVSWIIGAFCYAQAWRAYRMVSPRYRVAFHIAAALLFLLILSTLGPYIRFYSDR
jgi:hypothetical protein